VRLCRVFFFLTSGTFLASKKKTLNTFVSPNLRRGTRERHKARRGSAGALLNISPPPPTCVHRICCTHGKILYAWQRSCRAVLERIARTRWLSMGKHGEKTGRGSTAESAEGATRPLDVRSVKQLFQGGVPGVAASGPFHANRAMHPHNHPPQTPVGRGRRCQQSGAWNDTEAEQQPSEKFLGDPIALDNYCKKWGFPAMCVSQPSDSCPRSCRSESVFEHLRS
jgi:hypothetical protein